MSILGGCALAKEIGVGTLAKIDGYRAQHV
jgi:hypothetical protein